MMITHLTTLLLLLLLSIGIISCTKNSTVNAKENLAGMYRLYRIEDQDSSGNWKESDWGKGKDGYIIYDGMGHMAVQIIPKSYKDFNWISEGQTLNLKSVQQKIDSMSTDELRTAVSAFASDYVYVANYSVDDTAKLITHNRLTGSIPSTWNTEVKRKYSFSGDTLTLRNPTANLILKWVREK